MLEGRAVEPLGLLPPASAADAVAAGIALPFQGGPWAFSVVRLHETGRAPCLARVGGIPARFDAVLGSVVAAPPSVGLPDRPSLMAILNATPDSFSDPGLHLDPARAVEAGARFVAEGAAILDVGGESTRPGAVPPTPEDEIARVEPVLRGLAGCGAALSVDTRRARVMEAALAAGASIVNDVSGLAFDPEAADLLAGCRCPVVLMHSRGTPQTMASLARYDDVALEVVLELDARIDRAVGRGIDRARIVVDPGIGFAKTAAQGIALLARLPILASLGCRILLGVSRKSFIGRVAEIADPRARGAGSVVAARAADPFRNAIHRVHDVAGARQALAVASALAAG